MDLIELPVELLSRVCRFLGRASGTNNNKYSYKNRDFGSLRSTCKAIYARTEFDASIRYGLQECRFYLEPSSLALFLHLSRIPAFRNRMLRITVCPPKKPKTISDYEWYLLHEDEYSFVRSGEAARVLAQCFRQHQDADSFIELELPFGTHIISEQTTVLRALQLSQFPEKVAYVYLWLQNSQKPEWALFANSLSEFRPWIMKAIFLTQNAYGKDVAKSREVGAHIKNVRPVHPDVLKVVAATTSVERLQLLGCNEVPELRICHGCESLFSTHMMARSYEHLQSLELSDLYLSGSRLRGFLKRAEKLVWFEATEATLTDGSWKSIYQRLRKLPLWHVYLGRNYQKGGPLTPAVLPHACRDGHANKGRKGAYHDNINVLLDAMITYFHVCRVHREQEYRGPKYFEVCFFDIPELRRENYQSDIQRYAAELEGN
ncbi:uncharacterized protein J4E92_006606 [Alternaria infectoria]|uniref:uncharacterized protein n=1 Tax=Alternaria infectoria TaxID=45303 RepID=UPI0022201FDA|nr:uncharacterized protein J4E92_006606 [Alternaria infectoria]KAI4925870.1 hypothetical protein J4E92_006606 [Alternaria infectoria]